MHYTPWSITLYCILLYISTECTRMREREKKLNEALTLACDASFSRFYIEGATRVRATARLPAWSVCASRVDSEARERGQQTVRYGRSRGRERKIYGMTTSCSITRKPAISLPFSDVEMRNRIECCVYVRYYYAEKKKKKKEILEDVF